MKKIVIASDSFKGTMSSVEVCKIIQKGIHNIRPDIKTIIVPIADGGEGTVEAYLAAIGGTRIDLKVKDPLFREIDSFYAILPDKKTAVIEMAAASGLPLVEEEKNPCKTTTYGTGQLVLDALNRGCTKIILGIGGSATNDGGIGFAAALGVKFLDEDNNPVPLNGEGLAQLQHIDISQRDKRLDSCEIIVACDVDNPLYGENGAAYIFAPQKGADGDMVKYLDDNLKHYAGIIHKELGIRVHKIPGGGAAGGLGAGLMAFASAKLQSGIKTILDTVNFDEIICEADLIITGEGKIDGQSLRGKVPIGIGERALASNIPAVAIVGDIGDDIEMVYKKGINAVFSINRLAIPFEKARLRSKIDLLKTVETLMRFSLVF
ncbi:MAG: glycerate kinase [Clostridia bacterium]|nr:glycerate kinase [Clostridia bacterium]